MLLILSTRKKEVLFALIFEELPTVSDLYFGTARLACVFRLKEELKHEFELQNTVGEPTVPQVEPIFGSVLKTYYKLQELGFTEVDGKIVYIDDMEVKP